MANPKLATLQDPFQAAAINTALWNNITAGAATLDTVNDLVVLAQPVSSGVNTFGSNAMYDATGSAVYAQITPSANGSGHTETAMLLILDSNNSVAIRLDLGVFNFALRTAGTTTTTALPAYSPDAHRWWRIREAGGVFYADVSPDGWTWTTLASTAYTWSATAVHFAVQAASTGTEVAGNAVTIAGVNSLAGGAANPNWPLIGAGWGAHWQANGGDSPLDRYVSVANRLLDGWDVQRGRQYELDQPQSGTLDLTLRNNDAVLDPTNAAGPYYGHIAPYQPMRLRAQWPPTRNLLTQVQATAGDLGGQPLGTINASSSGPSIFSDTDSSGGSFVTSASAWLGGTCMQFAVPAATGLVWLCYTPQVDVQPGAQFTVTVRVRNVTASTTASVAAAVQFFDATQSSITYYQGASATLPGGTSAAWSTVTATGTAPAGAAMMYVGVVNAAAPSAAVSVQVDGWQVEQAPQPSSWCCPGVWYPVYAGYSERWPSAWTLSGTYGQVTPTAVDALALLSQVTLPDPLTGEMGLWGLRYLYALGDPEGSTSFTDSTGNFPAAQVGQSKMGPGTLTAGNSITAASPAGVYTGSDGTVVSIANPNPGTDTTSAASFINLASAGITGPVGTAFSRMIAFRYTAATPTLFASIWGAQDNRHGATAASSQLHLYIDLHGWTNALIQQAASGTGIGMTDTTHVTDGNWHLAIFGYDSVSQTPFLSVDGNYSTADTGVFWPSGIVSDAVGSWIDGASGNAATQNFQGDISFVAEFTTALSADACGAIWAAWGNAFTGDASEERYQRILQLAGYTGLWAWSQTLTTAMGSASGITGTDALSALQAVVDTEGGEHFVARDGTLTFRGRAARYNALTPAYTFGERVDLGEWPYEEVDFDFDSTHLSNTVVVTQESTGQQFSARSAASQAAYFPRSLTRTINSTSVNECQDAANYLLSRYAQPLTRVSGITLHPSAVPAMWPVCLSLELGTRVRVMRRPPGVPPVTVDCFVEQISWSTEADTGDATVTLMCSPIDPTPYGVFGSYHTTLNNSPVSGASTIIINPGVDNTNPARAQLTGGQQLILGLGTAAQETVTIAPGGVSVTSAGWTTCVLQLTSPTVNNHSSGDVVCEPLPAGITDPTTWDATSKFDGCAFAY